MAINLTEDQVRSLNETGGDLKKVKETLESFYNPETDKELEEVALSVSNLIVAHGKIPYFKNQAFLNPDL